MDETQKARLLAEFRIMDYTNTKTNYVELARKYNKDYRTIKKYHEGYEENQKQGQSQAGLIATGR